MIKDCTKHAKFQNTSTKIKKVRDGQSSIETLPCSKSTRKIDQPDLLSHRAKSDMPKMGAKKLSQPRQSQMCHVLGDPVRSAGVSADRNSSTKRGISNHFYGSQIVLGNDKDYIEPSHYRKSYAQTPVSIISYKLRYIIEIHSHTIQ
jgi:hypothetical protein